MTFDELLTELTRQSLELRKEDQTVRYRARAGGVDSALVGELRAHKARLLSFLEPVAGEWCIPVQTIAPEMLPLVSLSQRQIDAIVARVPGGAVNIKDIYPLAPMQEGMLFHHLSNPHADIYLETSVLAVGDEPQLTRILAALQNVIDRHDILRTSMAWRDLDEPVQVVWRKARLLVEDVGVEWPAGEREVAAFLQRHFSQHSLYIDLERAPLMRALTTHDPEHNRWLLVLQSHHIATDHTSLEIIVEELQEHLAGRAERLLPSLPFRSFVVQARASGNREEQQRFFTRMLGDVTEPTIPFGLSGVHEDGTSDSHARLALSVQVAHSVRQQARRLGVSPASLLHLAWALVLARTTGRLDVVFGTVLFGRLQGGESAERGLGMFMNTLPLRIELGATSVENAVRDTHASLIELLQHEHAPLALAQRCSGVPSPAPLFSALLNYRRDASPDRDANAEHRAAAGSIEWLSATDRTHYPVSLSIDDDGQGFAFAANAWSPVDPVRICSFMHAATARLVEALEQAPLTPARSIDALPDEERALIRRGWEDPTVSFDGSPYAHGLFEQQVERDPHALAIVHDEEQLTYGQLNTRADLLAQHLIGLGVTPDSNVALLIERGVDMVVAVLAVLKAGGAYVPLDPDYPPERLAYIVQDSQPVALLTQRRLRAVREAMPASLQVVELDAGWPSGPEATPTASSHPVPGMHESKLAYVIYTSGSTGHPKGVAMPHRAFVNLLHWQLGMDAVTRPRTLQFAALGFDVASQEILSTLSHGGCLVIVDSATRQDFPRLLRLIADRGIQRVFLPVAAFHALTETADALPVNLHELRDVVVAGEALRLTAAARRFFVRLPNCRLHNQYGPTETHVVTFHCLTGDPQHWPTLPPIGTSIANARIYLLDAQGRPVPIGVPGEIYIGGRCVARGYLRRPELTAERFVIDPFAREADARMYKSGDIGRQLPDGSVEFLGRIDFQVKIRGFRVELGEIEARLLDHPGVAEVAVVAREGQLGDKRLVAYYTSHDGAPSDPESLRAHLTKVLPDYMVPPAYVLLAALPLTPNGKLDRKALPEPEGSAFGARVYEPPQGPVEVAMAAIWAELLGVTQVGRNDDFFHLGGHSLLAVRVASRIRSTLGADVALTDLFKHPKLAAFAAQVHQARRVDVQPLIPIDRSQF